MPTEYGQPKKKLYAKDVPIIETRGIIFVIFKPTRRYFVFPKRTEPAAAREAIRPTPPVVTVASASAIATSMLVLEIVVVVVRSSRTSYLLPSALSTKKTATNFDRQKSTEPVSESWRLKAEVSSTAYAAEGAVER